jgi:hypothetical protein
VLPKKAGSVGGFVIGWGFSDFVPPQISLVASQTKLGHSTRGSDIDSIMSTISTVTVAVYKLVSTKLLQQSPNIFASLRRIVGTKYHTVIPSQPM